MEAKALPYYVFNTHEEAEEAIRILSRGGMDIRQISLVGKGYHSEEHPVGFYTMGDRILSWGGAGAFWGGLWGLLFAPGIFLLPGIGVVALAGPLVALLVSGVEGAVVVGGVSALAAALFQVGMSKDDVIRYETALKADKFILMVHGTAGEVEHAQALLEQHRVLEMA